MSLLAGNTEPEGGRGDSGYYLPGIGVAPRVSLATRGGRDAPRVRRDQCTKLDAHSGGRDPPSPPCFFNGGGRVGDASRKICYRYEI